MKSQRQLQIGENIKRIMSEIFLRDDVAAYPGSIVTILEADVSPDAKNVRIFVDIFGNEKSHDLIVKTLNKAAPHFRFQMAKRITLRVVPEITFVLDRTQQKAMKLESLIEEEAQKIAMPKVKNLAKKSPAKKRTPKK